MSNPGSRNSAAAKLRLLPLAAAALLAALAASAQQQPAGTMYVTREFKTGLHEERSIDSAITALIAAGTALEIVKREEPLSFVRTPDGATGWIDNSYLVAEAPSAGAELKQERERADALERRVAELQQQAPAADSAASGGGEMADALRKQNAELEQSLKQERLRAGELQVQVSELRKRIGINSDNASLYDRIDELQSENKRLQVALSGAGAAGGTETGGGAPAARSLLAWFVLVLIAGFGGGIFLMDWRNRRRHGGFRV